MAVPYLAREHIPPGVISRRREKQVAKQLGGRATRGSGNKRYDPGDVSLLTSLGEHKMVFCASYRLTLAVLEKIETEAQRMGRTSFLMIEFRTGGRSRDGRTFYVVPDYVMRRYVADEKPKKRGR
jgi:hypothetical protein